MIHILLIVALGMPQGGTQDEPNVQAPLLRDELLRRVKVDQEAREALTTFMAKHAPPGGVVDLGALKDEEQAEFTKIAERMAAVDAENTGWMKTVVESSGWPGVTLVGKDGAGAAWLMVQHADADVAFQRRCLDLMTKLPKGEVSAKDVAYLTDRVLLAEGKKQLYGTQFSMDGGQLRPKPIEDEANVDRRRAEVGLPSMAEYERVMRDQYGGK